MLKDSDDSPPFSLNDLNKTHLKIRHYRKEMARQTLVLEEVPLSPEPLGLNLEDPDPLFKEATFESLSLHDEFNHWLETKQAKYFKTRISRVTNVAQCGPYNNNSASISGMEMPSHTKAAGSYSAYEEPIRGVEYTSSQLSYQELKEENCMLKRKIQTFSASLAQMARNLERAPQATRSKEEKDTQDLEALVQQVEQNVHVMTEAALKAKCDNEKMKQEISFLQAELTCYKLENRSLRSGQSTNMGAVKRHVDVALQNLIKVSNYAQATIRQIVFGANTLMLFGNLQESRRRIAETEKEDEVVKEPTT